MKECISIKTDYSLMKSIIKIPSLVNYALENKYKTLGIVDDNLSSSIEFIEECHNNGIKPIIGLDTSVDDLNIYIYAKDENSLKKLFKLNTFLLDNKLTIEELAKYNALFLYIIPYESIALYDSIIKYSDEVFLGYCSNEEKTNCLLISKKIIYFNLVLSLNQSDAKYINYLHMIEENKTYKEYEIKDYSSNFISAEEDISIFTNLINIAIPKNPNLIPHYDNKIIDSYKYLETLSIKGLNKRLNNNIPDNYKKRLLFELKIIKQMNFVDYFLIVYDYVKYAIKNDILVGPGRGSAAGSLVTYSLGITAIDPLKYDLLFERFLNPERISMPDIDIDFDADKRQEVIDYVKKRYGDLNVMPILTYGTLAAKQILLSLSKVLEIDATELFKFIDAHKNLKANLTPQVTKILNGSNQIKNLYYDAMKLEGIKKHISTHAAGIVICNTELDNIIPIIKSADTYLTGYTMNYLENMGLLKMDFLAIKDLSSIANILKMIPTSVNINNIDLNDKKVLDYFTTVNTIGVFQFESEGMKNFLRKLKPSKFSDLVVALALYRPGPMENIDLFIKRKDGNEKVEYLVPELELILKETFGIIVYQEQIMQIFNKIASYTVAEADIIRRAISKKKESVILKEKENFIAKAYKNGHNKQVAEDIYNLIMKFANYGFNKAHSVGYALVAYQMMYLKVYYPEQFYVALLNTNIGSISKTKEYLDEAKKLNLKILKPDINLSTEKYKMEIGIRIPFTIIKNIGYIASTSIVNEREKNGLFKDFYDFVARTYSKGINMKTIESLIYSGCLDVFNQTRHSLIENIKNAIMYAELMSGLDSLLVSKPILNPFEEYPANELMQKELELFGFYVSNHPASLYPGIKLKEINNYFDKTINIVALLESVKSIKTKKNETMAFLQISDETTSVDCILFPNRIDYINYVKKGDLLMITGKVEKRMDKYQLIISNVKIMK